MGRLVNLLRAALPGYGRVDGWSLFFWEVLLCAGLALGGWRWDTIEIYVR